MKTLKDINLSKFFPSVIFRRGMEYFNKNRVSDLTYDMNHQVWTATVYGTEEYFVEISMEDIANNVIETHCDCPAFDTYNSCKHIVAVLLSVQAQDLKGGVANANRNYTLTDNFIHTMSAFQSYEKKTVSISTELPLQVEYYIKTNYKGQLLLELKVGESHCYVVKNAFQFLEAVHDEREHFFTKKFTYQPREHYFLQQDLAIFEKLYAIYYNESIYQSSFLPHSGSADKRFILLPTLIAKNILEMLEERTSFVTVQEHTHQPLVVEKDSLPFQFLLEKNDNKDVTLSLTEGNDVEILMEYEMLYSEGVFYYSKREQLNIVKSLNRFNLKHFELAISKAQADQFFSEVIPSLKVIGDVQVAEEIIEEVIQVPLQAKFYLEQKEDIITGKLEYHYGKHLIDPFNGRELHDVIIMRDVESEAKIMQLIELANFHYNGKELFLESENEEELYEFLYHILPKLAEKLELFLTSELKYMIVEHEPSATTNVKLDSATNLLEISFDIDGVDDQEVHEILQAVIEKKRFYRLQSGAVMSLENDAFSSINKFFNDMNVKNKDLTDDGNVQMPLYRSAQIDELIETKKTYDPAFRSLMHHLQAPEEQVYELPTTLNATLRNYQVTGYQWFKSLSHYHLGGILADDMGLGKTIQTISYIASEPSDKIHLVVAPSSVVYNWKNEFDKFTPHLNVAILTGTPQERQKKIEEEKHMDVWITSYSTLRQDIELYKDIVFQSMIIDEAQFIKNYATKTSQAIRQVQATRRFALSGTPIENSIEELWAIFQVVLPGLMPSQRVFKQLSNEKIAAITRPFILRRLKQDVLKELPDKIESVSVSELTQEQKELYVGYLQQVQSEAKQSINESGFNQNRMKILAGLTRLRQICCHPSLFIENYEGTSGKLEQLMDTVKTALENKKRMLIFSQFTSMHEIIIKELEKDGIDFFYLSGKTPSEERLEMSERFNGGEKDIFLISLKAGGTGLNLTGADTVILYDLWWNPAVEDQATGRAHRFGQKNIVQVIRLIAEGTIEEKIYELQQKKRELINQVIQPGEAMLSSLSEDDIKELLSL
ncbi:SNF2 helicase associated domain-containing protein [Oceanobacillus sp. CAU 1775]